MALFPCSVGGHRYPGRAQHAYLNVVNGASTDRMHLRLCEGHFAEVVGSALAHLDVVTENTQFEQPRMGGLCVLRGEALVGRRMVFFTWYDGNTDGGTAAYGEVCVDCGASAKAVLSAFVDGVD